MSNFRRIQLRRSTATEWESVNPVLSAGEAGVEFGGSSPKLKIGDGVSPWKLLNYIAGGGSSASGGAAVNLYPFCGDTANLQEINVWIGPSCMEPDDLPETDLEAGILSLKCYVC